MKKTVVFDLDSTLVYCFRIDTNSSFEAYEKLKRHPNYSKIKDKVFKCEVVDCLDNEKKGVGKLRTFVVFLRPHVKELIQSISKNYNIDIWSAGQMRYVWMLNYYIFSSHCNVRNIYSFSDCIITENSVSKNLKSKNYDMENTTIIDDREDVCEENKGSSFNISPFEPNVYNPEKFFEDYFKDNALIDIKNFLEK